MRYVVSKAELLRKRVKIFPIGKFFRGGWRAFTREDAREMVAHFQAGRPNSLLPVNIEHRPELGRVGTIRKLWLEDDGVYAEIEWTEQGEEMLRQGRFQFFSPEVAWRWVDPKDGKVYRNVLVGGALTNYPFHGDDAVLFSHLAQEQLSVLEKLGVWEINPRSLRNVSDQELLNLHRRMHMLAVSLRKFAPTPQDVHVPGSGDEEEKYEEEKESEEIFVSIEDVVNAHLMIVEEMKRRGMHHAPEGPQNWLDQRTQRMMRSTASKAVQRLKELDGEVLLVPGFISIVGSAVKDRRPGDLDVLVRADKEGNYYRLSHQAVWLPLRKVLDPYKEGLPMRWVSSAQGPHDDALVVGDLVLKLRPRFLPVEKELVEKRVRTFLYFVGTGALDSPRRDASLMISSERSAVLFDAGPDIEPKHLPRIPDIILVTDPKENLASAKDLGEKLGVQVSHGDWAGPDMKVTAFPVVHTNHDVFGYRIEVSDVTIAYAPEFWKFPAKEVQGVDIGIFDGSAFDRPIAFAGGKGGHAAILDTLIEAERANVKRVIFTHIGKPVEEHLYELQVSGVEIAEDGQAVVVKAGLEPGRQNFKPVKTGAGYGKNEFGDADVAWEVWGRANAPFAVEEKYDGWRALIHKKGDRVWIFSEDARRDLSERLPRLVEDVKRLPADFIVDGELTIHAEEPVQTKVNRYAPGDKIERQDMPSFISAKEPKGKFREVYYAFDIVYRDGDIHRLPWTERRKQLAQLLRGRETAHLKLAPTRIVDNKQEFLRAVEWAFNQPYSEGAMLKNIKAFYPLDGESLEIAKLKALKEVRVRVVAKRRSSRGAWIYTGALSDGSIIGNTYATGVDADVGDVLEVRVAEVKVHREGDKVKFTWDNPIVHSKKPRGTAVTTPQQAMAIAKLKRTRPTRKELDEEEAFDEEVLHESVLDLVAEAVRKRLEPISKPYARNADLPAPVRKVLPEAAQTIWRKAFNAASGPESRRAQIAWDAVKRAGYEKVDGRWTKRS